MLISKKLSKYVNSEFYFKNNDRKEKDINTRIYSGNVSKNDFKSFNKVLKHVGNHLDKHFLKLKLQTNFRIPFEMLSMESPNQRPRELPTSTTKLNKSYATTFLLNTTSDLNRKTTK